MTAPIRYARSGDVSIAYQVTGDGPLDLVLVPGFFSHLEIDWEHPGSARVFDRLGSFSRLIRFDKRGTGLSDRAVGLPDLSDPDGRRPRRDGCGRLASRAALFGYSEGGPLSVLFAASYPERARALVLYGVYAKRRDPDDDYPWAPTREERLRDATALEARGARSSTSRRSLRTRDASMTTWLQRRGRASLSPAGARDLILMNSQVDVRDLLSSGPVPDARPPSHGRPRRAESTRGGTWPRRIPGARFVELAGDDHVPFVEPDQVLDEVEEFLTGVRPAPVSDRVLATVLFTDLVGSTERATELGDAAWAALLAEHNGVVRRELAPLRGGGDRHGGRRLLRALRRAGQGDSVRSRAPSGARRARARRARRRAHGRDRAAAGDKPRGIAVHVGARIMSLGRAGDVLVSATTHDLVAGSGLEFEDRGEHVLKGVEGARRLFAAL